MAGTNQAVHQRLFADDTLSVYSVLDGASVPNLRQKMYDEDPTRECLYRGDLQPDMAEVAPYLVRLDKVSRFTNWVIEQGWGNHWGIFALSQQDLGPLRRHFRTLLVVHDSNARPLYFRYYDPRVLRVYLPTCNASELAAIFGPVERYFLEASQPGEILTFGNNSGVLLQSKEEIKGD